MKSKEEMIKAIAGIINQKLLNEKLSPEECSRIICEDLNLAPSAREDDSIVLVECADCSRTWTKGLCPHCFSQQGDPCILEYKIPKIHDSVFSFYVDPDELDDGRWYCKDCEPESSSLNRVNMRIMGEDYVGVCDKCSEQKIPFLSDIRAEEFQV